MASKYHLQIVTPDRIFFDEEVESAIVRTVEGDVGILSDHMLMVAPLDIGKMQIKKDGKTLSAAIAGGFIQVDEDKTVIITDAAEWPEEIDLKRAEEALKRAEARLNPNHNHNENIDVIRAEIALKKAMNRIEVASRERK